MDDGVQEGGDEGVGEDDGKENISGMNIRSELFIVSTCGKEQIGDHRAVGCSAKSDDGGD